MTPWNSDLVIVAPEGYGFVVDRRGETTRTLRRITPKLRGKAAVKAHRRARQKARTCR